MFRFLSLRRSSLSALLAASLAGLVACAGATTVQAPTTTATRRPTVAPAKAATPAATQRPGGAGGSIETEATPTPTPTGTTSTEVGGNATPDGGGSSTGGGTATPEVTEAPTPTPEPLPTPPPVRYVSLTVRNVTPIKLTVPPTTGTPAPGIKSFEALNFEWLTNRGQVVLNAKFSVDPANIAVVSTDGVVTAKSEGTGNVRIIAPDESTYSLVPVVIEAVGSLNMEVE
ncbi:MAG: hypothetical protein VKO64_12300 [Candidatus Sericytochromatia bacterium]|nr:hypothetical protein [Candidatus Sericytochromatia bacterium]